MSIQLILLVAAAVCFFLSAIRVSSQHIDITATGLFLWVLSILIAS